MEIDKAHSALHSSELIAYLGDAIGHKHDEEPKESGLA
jgi:hypothetical protein